jgi:tRNA U34 5-methylaminomethyl-2-thiouridine-forming methyltransferase MnmC
MERKIITTGDGSHSIFIPDLNVTYHSINGAIQESKHVFIEAGLNFILSNSKSQTLNIFEMGFGTGLNAFLTAIEADKRKLKIHFTALEKFPVSVEEVKALNYTEHLQQPELFQKIHTCEWNEEVTISECFSLRKEKASLLNYLTSQLFNLIYYDAFAPAAQPELWTNEIFQKLFGLLQPNGVLVTYCSKGNVRRAMIAVGFKVEKLKGPPGKREMVRAIKINP